MLSPEVGERAPSELPKLFGGSLFLVVLEVRAERKRRRWSQMRLASESGLSLPTVIAAEAGRNVSLETAFRLSNAFERSPASDEAVLEAAEA